VVFPTRKIVPVVVICLIVIGGIFALLEYKNHTKTINNDGVISVTDQKLIDSIANKDTDNDGLKDWEEALWKTAPDNPDTDGDGTPDGAEIAAGRSPLIKGPNDQITTASTTPSTTRKLTASDQFSRDLFTRYVTIKQTGSGDPANYDNYADLVQSYIDQEASTMSAKIYSASDFKVITNETPADVHLYGNELGALFVDYSAPKFENELIVLQRAVDNNNPLELDKLNANILAYQKGRAALLKMAVPSIFLPDHIALTNTISTITLGIESMKLTFSNPIKAAAGLQNYPDATDNFYPLLKSIKDGLMESGVSFTQAESGFQFINIIE
jgi:hypothetical protein